MLSRKREQFYLLAICSGLILSVLIICSFFCVKEACARNYFSDTPHFAGFSYSGTQTINGAKYNMYIPTSDMDEGCLYVVYKGPVNKNLRSYTIPKSVLWNTGGRKLRVLVVKIGKEAFKGCKKVERISCNAKLDSIGSRAFMNCKRLKTFKSYKAIYNIKSKAFYGCTALKTFQAKKYSINNIGASAFYNCKKLNSFTAMGYRKVSGWLTLPGSYEREHSTSNRAPNIGDKSFYNCRSLKMFSIKVTKDDQASLYVGEKAFYNCSKLKTLTIKGATNRMSLRFGGYAFYKCTRLRSIVGLKDSETLECSPTTFRKTPLSKKFPGVEI